MSKVTIGFNSFKMTDSEWVQAKTWILNDQQEKAMRWWSSQFDLSLYESVGIISRIQVLLQFGTEDQVKQMVSV